MRRVVTILVIFALMCTMLALPAHAQPGQQSKSYLLIARGNSLSGNLAKQVSNAGGTVTATLPQIGIAVATSTDPHFKSRAARISGMRSVVPNIPVRWIDPGDPVAGDVGNPPSSGNDDSLLDLQWGHDAVDAPEAWAAGATGDGVRVAVLDDGIDSDHPDLASNLNVALSASFVPGEPFEYVENVPGDPFSHGTHVSGTIAAADNGLGTIGIAPEAEIVMVKVLSSATGSGSWEGVLAGIIYAADIDADIINMSLGAVLARSGYCEENPDTGEIECYSAREVAEIATAMGRATTYAYQQGTTVIASAGNDAIDRDHDKDTLVLPADSPHVISVSATGPLGWANDPDTDLDTPAFYTNYGQSRIDFAAPGGTVDFDLLASGASCTVAGVTRPCFVFDFVYSTGSAGRYYWSIGTSMAAPHVSGVAALIISQNGGSMHPTHVESALRASADDLGKPGNDDFYGAGRVNAANAVE